MFKFKLHQKVYYIKDNKIHSAPILSRMYVDNHINETYTAQQYDLFNSFGPTGIRYSTVHGEFGEHQLFPTKEELKNGIK